VTFEQLLENIKSFPCQEVRSMESDYCEVVVSKENLQAMQALLGTFFGPPIKPEGEMPSSEASQKAKPHGGIFQNQTLYFFQNNQKAAHALLWPWGSGAAITLKVIREK
jgi:hypothetical protein